MKNKLIKGTLILTMAGIVTRVIGFLYRIFLSNQLGESNLGIYQLIFPVYSICFTLYAAGIQTAVSQMISHKREVEHPSIMKSALLFSLVIAGTLSIVLHYTADTIAIFFLNAQKTAELLKILATIFPFCGITAIINGYFYGISDAKIPAVTQLLEQIARVLFVALFSFLFLQGTLDTATAVWGLVAGELVSNIYNVLHLKKKVVLSGILRAKFRCRELVQLTLPLSGNKLIIALLSSVESILIPAMLIRFGYSKEEALAVFGVLTGIVLPFILFPGTITNSLSVLLLPEISRAAGRNQFQSVRKTASATIKYSLFLGILTSSLFLNFGKEIGMLLFHSENAGKLLESLTFLCPFLYVSTTLTSIINGLGKTGISFLHSIIGLTLRIACLLFLTPKTGIWGYLLGLTLSQIVICLFNGIYLSKRITIQYELMNHLLWPLVFSTAMLYIAKKAGQFMMQYIPSGFCVFIFVIPAYLLIFLYLYAFKYISLKEFTNSD